MTSPMDIVILGLSLSSSWGNGHATTYRSLIRGLDALGCRVHFLERDVPWYRENRDLAPSESGDLSFYDSVTDLERRYGDIIHRADAVVIGSYVPDGVAVIDLVRRMQRGVLCFYDIDTPVTLAKLDRRDEEYLALRQIPAFDIYFSFSGGDVLRRLETQYGARLALPLYCSVDAAAYRHTGEASRWDLGYLGTYSADRQPALDRLLLEPARRLPHRRFVVAGSLYPDTLVWPANVERIDHLPPAEHPSFYSRQRFTLNVTRADMVAAGWSPSVRLFEAGAVGTPIISDRWRGLGHFLPENKAILIARDADDVVRFLEQMPQLERQHIADAARARTLGSHTGRVRAGELLASLRQFIAAPPVTNPLETV
jgi:spore maturation protein CgeB